MERKKCSSDRHLVQRDVFYIAVLQDGVIRAGDVSGGSFRYSRKYLLHLTGETYISKSRSSGIVRSIAGLWSEIVAARCRSLQSASPRVESALLFPPPELRAPVPELGFRKLGIDFRENSLRLQVSHAVSNFNALK